MIASPSHSKNLYLRDLLLERIDGGILLLDNFFPCSEHSAHITEGENAAQLTCSLNLSFGVHANNVLRFYREICDKQDN